MRVGVLNKAGVLRIEQRPEPELLPGTVIIDIERCGIGGPDIEAWKSGVLPAAAWFGHEWVGRVREVGTDCPERFEGERVVGAVPPPCGRCAPCRAGLGNNCETALAMIVGTDPSASSHGAFAEKIRADARRVYPVPEGVDDADATLAEPAAVAAHAVARAGQRLGDVVVVVGAGTIGILVAELARLAGASKVAAVDLEPARRELACVLGADAAFASGSDARRWACAHGHGLGADVVYECAGQGAALIGAAATVRQGGTVVLVGPSSGPVGISPAELIAREITIRASLGYTVADVHRALDLMADDRFRVSNVYDRTIGFDELATTFAELACDPGAKRKVLFSPHR